MKRIFVIFALFCAFFMVSCGGSSVNNENGAGQATGNIGELNGECYPNNTCNKGLICDIENNLCIEDSENPVNDSDDPSEQNDDAADTSSEQNDDKPDTSDSTDDSDSADPCSADPCKNIENSTGVCTADGGNYSCGCNENYEWNGTTCAASTHRGECEPKPANTVWNDNGANGTFEQTWNGSEWVPSSYPSTFSKTPGTCNFKCASGSAWNGSSCDSAPTTVSDCTGLPENAIWNTTSAIVQTYDGVSWEPSTVGVYDITPSQSECHFICKPNYDWTGSQCVPATQQVECTGLPKNAEWNTAASITQTWNGSEWKPSTNSYYSTSASTTECRYKCKLNYNWSDGECVAATRTVNCTTLPFGAQWNAVSSITQTWNGETWIPSNTTTYNTTQSSSECRYKCKTNYTWNSTQKECLADTQTSNCTNLPAGAKWNTYSTVIQTWDGSSWQPSTNGVYNETASKYECRYICDTHYKWNNSKCVADTQIVACTDLPANAHWNTVSKITQTWEGNSWQPSTTGAYNEVESSKECRFICDDTYHWNNSVCVPNTKLSNCTGLPENAEWNTAETITQTWNGLTYEPTTDGVPCYSSSGPFGFLQCTSSTTQCVFKCKSNYYWYDSECVSPCDYEPCEEAVNSTGVCTATSWNNYKCECNYGYIWSGTKCKKMTLGNMCTGQTSCYNETALITCPTSSTADFYGQDAQYRGKCTAKSFTVETVNGQPVVLDNKTFLEWQQAAPSTTYTWENAKTYCSDLIYAGYDDWRLPTPQELLTIVDNSKNAPAVDTTYFTGMSSNSSSVNYWSSKPYGTNQVQAIKLYYGNIIILSTTTFVGGERSENVVCVRGNELPSASFTTQMISSEIVVKDSVTGLMWQKTYPSSRYTWVNALKYCEDLVYAGYDDWHLPNKNELASLINYDKSEAPYSDFPDMPTGFGFWSSSTFSGNTDDAWNVNFGDSKVGNNAKTGTNFVRCVR